MEADGRIILTKSGLEIAQCINERHELIQAVLMSLGVDEATADADACKLEHELSEKSLASIREHYHKKKSE